MLKCQNISGWAWKLSQNVSPQAGTDLALDYQQAWTQGGTPREKNSWEQRLTQGVASREENVWETEAAGVEWERGKGVHWLKGWVSREWRVVT